MVNLRQYNAGEIIIKEGDSGESVYIIKEGRVKVTKETDGKEVHLAYCNAGQILGEMSMIDDKPRSATVTAVEKTVVHEVFRDSFFHNLQSDPDVPIKILKILFRRLREAQVKILQLQAAGSKPEKLSATQVCGISTKSKSVVSLEGLTPEAVQALPKNPLQITEFPFRIGRVSSDPLVDNDLMIPDTPPLQVSRHHVELIFENGRIGALDRGSHLGSLVDGQLLGGAKGDIGPIFFKRSEGTLGTLVLGVKKSPFRYKLVK